MSNREQKLVDVCFQIAMTVTDETCLKYFNEDPNRKNERIAEWVAKQLDLCGFPTYPVGSSWGVLKK